MKHLTASRGYALTECGLTVTCFGELTADPSERECDDCRDALIAKGVCPECMGKTLRWDFYPASSTFYLGCPDCSETLISNVAADKVLAVLNNMAWRP